MCIRDRLIAYHAAGGSFLPDIPKYATQNAVDYGYRGGGKALIDNFTAAFGAIFDSSLHKIDHIIEAVQANIGGWDFIIHPTPEAYDLDVYKRQAYRQIWTLGGKRPARFFLYLYHG